MTEPRLVGERNPSSTISLRADSLEGARSQMREAISTLRDSTVLHGPKLSRIEVDVPSISPLLWLSAQSMAGRSYFCNRQRSVEMAGVGLASIITESTGQSTICNTARSIINNTSARAIGGFRFESRGEASPEWNGFSSARFVLPRFDIVHADGKCHFSMNVMMDGTLNTSLLLRELDHLNLFLPRVEKTLPAIVARDDQPHQDNWSTQVRSLLDGINSKSLEKAVLARRTTLNYFEPVDAVALLNRMHEREAHCYGFYMEDDGGRGFVSVSPERLYYREGSTIEVEALAGTRPRSTSPSDDDLLAKELLNSAKDMREHRFVVRYISDALKIMCSQVDCSQEPSVVRFRRVQHLQTLFQGQLLSNIDDDTILALLHPTPAVAGYPADVSRQLIGSLEHFDRGWYAGPVGWISATGAEFAVGIRSALVDRQKVHLYAGCGIVEGSDPSREWDEMETKISGYMELFSGQ
jgi:menaquinone-specific isochorismate synthase